MKYQEATFLVESEFDIEEVLPTAAQQPQNLTLQPHLKNQTIQKIKNTNHSLDLSNT
jgi:hypothetical protein